MAENRPFLDFKEIKQRVALTDILPRYQVNLVRVNQTSLKGTCPLPSHSSGSKNTFFVNTAKSVWYCHSDSCKKNGHRAGAVFGWSVLGVGQRASVGQRVGARTYGARLSPPCASPPSVRRARALRRVCPRAARRGRRRRRPRAKAKRSSSPLGQWASADCHEAGSRTDSARLTTVCSSPPSVATRPHVAARSAMSGASLRTKRSSAGAKRITSIRPVQPGSNEGKKTRSRNLRFRRYARIDDKQPASQHLDGG